LIGKGAHQVAAEPCGEGGGEADSGDDLPIDQVARAGIVRGGGESGDNYDGERSGDRLFLPEAQKSYEGRYHDNAAADTAKRSEKPGDEADGDGDQDEFHGRRGNVPGREFNPRSSPFPASPGK